MVSVLLALAVLMPALDPPLRIRVVSGSIVAAPAYVRLRVSVQPDAANRWLIVQIDSGEYLRASGAELDGERAPRTHVIDYRDVPAGEYIATATVDRGRARRWVVSVPFLVVG